MKKKYIYSLDDVPVVVDPPYAGVLLRCTGATIRRLCREGELKGFKVGEMWRIRKDVLIEYTLRKQDNENTGREGRKK